jgi:hypothetical protein
LQKQAVLKALREGVSPRELKNIAPPELMRRVTRADEYQQWTKDFLITHDPQPI